MKSTGITRPVDALGRIVIPMEIRESFNIKTKDTLEIFVQGDKIILKKHADACIFCDSHDNLMDHEDKKVCMACVRKLASKSE